MYLRGNTAPYASDAYYSVLHDTTLSGQVYGYDPDGDAITAQLVSGPSNGTVTLNPDGTFTYAPNEHFIGNDSFTFSWSDTLHNSVQGTVFVTVYNSAPILAEAVWEYHYDWDVAEVLIAESQILAVAADPDGDALQVSVASGPRHGTLEKDGELFRYRVDPTILSYHWPEDALTLVDWVEFKVVDSGGAISETSAWAVIWLMPDFTLGGCAPRPSTTSAPTATAEQRAWTDRVDKAAQAAGLTDRFFAALVVREPIPNSGRWLGITVDNRPDVGHTFVLIVDRFDPSRTQAQGLYPARRPGSLNELRGGVPGKVEDDLNSIWTVGAAWPISEQHFVSIQQRFDYARQNPPNWHEGLGCADWAIDVLRVNGGINYMPEKYRVTETDQELGKHGSILFPPGSDIRYIEALFPGKIGKQLRERPPEGSLLLVNQLASGQQSSKK